MMFGMMCCRMTRRREAPRACTASTYTCSFTDRAADLTTRATRGMTGIEMAITTFCTAGPRIDAMARARISCGKGHAQHPENDQRPHGAERLRPDELGHLFGDGEARRQFRRRRRMGQLEIRRHG